MGKGKNEIKLKKVTELPPKASVALCFLLWRVWVPPPCPRAAAGEAFWKALPGLAKTALESQRDPK